MSVSYQAKDAAVLAVQLSTQEVKVQLGSQIISANVGSVVTIDFQEVVTVVSASFTDDSAGTAAPITAANRAVSGTTVAFTLSAPLAANDCITVSYKVTE